MRMKKSDLKKTLKPIIEECVRETLYESGLLSTIISEVVQGVMTGQEVLRETKRPEPKTSVKKPEPETTEHARTKAKLEQLQNQKKKLLESIGADAYNGVDLFEGTTPLKSGGKPSASPQSQGPFSGVDPSDPGVDIGSLTESLGGVWKKLAQGGKK